MARFSIRGGDSRAQLDEEAFAAAFAAGKVMTLKQAVDYALEDTKEN